MYTFPLISVILVTWNASSHVSHCFSALSRQSFRDFEVIVIDNGSIDDTLEIIESISFEFQVTVKKLNTNLGFAVANNIGARMAAGKWIALLNVDAYPERDWLENLQKATEQNPTCSAFSSRQIQYNAPHLLDGTGDTYHISGLAWRNAYNLSADSNGLEQKEIFSPCAAAALYSRKEFLKVGGFDEDYFSYFEDVDLGFRLRLLEAMCLYIPTAVVYHVGSASTGKRSDFSVYYGYRNLIWTFFKNMPFPWIWVFLPLHIMTLLFFSIYLSLRGQGRIIWRAIFDALHGIPRTLEKRKTIQENRKITYNDLFRVMSIGLLEPYQEFIRRNRSK